MIKLGRAARLWNGPIYVATNGGMGQDQNGLQTNALNKLADRVLIRLYVK